MWKILKAKTKGKKGFTLIEMIVVVAIIAILIALLVPSVMKFVKTARDTAESANAKTIYVATQTYIADQYTKGETVSAGEYGPDSLGAGKGLAGLDEYLSSDIKKASFTIKISDGSVAWVKYENTTYPPETSSKP